MTQTTTEMFKGAYAAEGKLVVPLGTALGQISIRWQGGKLEGIVLHEVNSGAFVRPAPFPVHDTRLVKLLEALAAYFSGEAVRFSVPLEFAGHTSFRRRVWRVVAEIPHGEVRTYGWVAARLGKPNAARAVGGALALNPFPIVVPCHRVLKGDGGLGGFSAGLGWKKALLQLEGICLK